MARMYSGPHVCIPTSPRASYVTSVEPNKCVQQEPANRRRWNVSSVNAVQVDWNVFGMVCLKGPCFLQTSSFID
jgi:hypothetical protein